MLLSPLSPNERKLLATVRKHGVMPRHKLVEHVDVSAQAIGQMVRKLDQYRLLVHHKAVKVGLGQPPKPMSIRADGAFSIGIKVGRRRTDVLLVDLLGEVREHHTVHYAFPVVASLLPQIEAHLRSMQAALLAADKALIGVGVAAPFALGGWYKLLGLSEAQASEWRTLDLQAAIAAMTPRPVRFAKDTAAACIAELLSAKGPAQSNYLYIFVDTFVGGSVVHQGRLLDTFHGNAGAIASLPMNKGTQLLEHASIWELERHFHLAGLDASAAYDERALAGAYWPLTESWLETASQALAACIVSGTAFLDPHRAVIDSSLAPLLLARLVAQTNAAMDNFNWEGLWRPEVTMGQVGSDAGALGGALMPLHDYFYA
jgi:predicted NBD/HSP70 family sugar kinase